MKFILWTLVWWGLHEIMWWRTYKYRTLEYIDHSVFALLGTQIITWVLYIYLYNHFIK